MRRSRIILNLSTPRMHKSALTSLILAAALCFSGCATPKRAPIEINLVAINDFHGQLEAHDKAYTLTGQPKRTIRVGGIDTIGGALQAWRKEDPQLLLVGAGDLLGATPALSSIWADEPTVEALNLLGLRLSSVGNHEFDRGTAELLRQQNGGCVSPSPDKACKLRPRFDGARFSYLSANVVDAVTGAPMLPPYRIEEVKGVKIAFIGAVLRDTARMVSPKGIAGVRFLDEVETINRWAAEIRKLDVAAIVLLIHQGGDTTEQFDQVDCSKLEGPIVGLVKQLDPAIRLVISAHSHKGYQCRVDGRVVTQAESFGHVLTRISMKVDPQSRAVSDIAVRNVLMEQGRFAPDPALAALLAEVQGRSKELLARPIARLAIPRISDKLDTAGASPLGDVASDAQLAATSTLGAQIVFINHKSLRVELESGPAGASYAQVAATHPYGNTLVLMTLTGAQIRAVLEQQNWLAEELTGGRRMLQVSQGFSYRWGASRPAGQRVVPGSIMLNGAPVTDEQKLRVSVNSFMAQGGDGYTVFTEGVDRLDSGILDLDAFIDYLAARDRAGKPVGSEASAGRIVRLR